MPMLTINTSVVSAGIPEEFLTDMSSLVSRLCGKPESYVCVFVNPDRKMTFGGTSEPCALCVFESIGKISNEENKKYTAAFMEFINRKLKVEVNRMYIKYVDLERENVGWNGTTFA